MVSSAIPSVLPSVGLELFFPFVWWLLLQLALVHDDDDEEDVVESIRWISEPIIN